MLIKWELVSIIQPEKRLEELERLLSCAESILKKLEMKESWIPILSKFCKKNKITLLRTVGVVFSDDEFRITQYIR